MFLDTPDRLYPLHWLSLLTSVTGVILLLLARGHYTIDVVIAYGITYWLWITYHTLANFPVLKSKHKDNQLKGLLWWHILRLDLVFSMMCYNNNLSLQMVRGECAGVGS